MTGQEERDVLFARLFGLTAVIQSGLLVRDTPLSTSASSQTAASNLANYQEVLQELFALGEKKSWLRESAWWTIGLAIDALSTSQIAWKKAAFDSTIQSIFVDNKTWSPEKVALTLKLQKYCPERDWPKLLGATFKQPQIVHTSNYHTLARILKVRERVLTRIAVAHALCALRRICKWTRTRTRVPLRQRREHGNRKCTLSGTRSSTKYCRRTNHSPLRTLSQNSSAYWSMVGTLTSPLDDYLLLPRREFVLCGVIA